MNFLRSIPLRSFGLAISSALLQVFIFPTNGPVHSFQPAIAWIALVPLLAAILAPGRDAKPLNPAQAAVIGYVSGITWYLGNCFWIYQTMYLYGGLAKPVSLLILVLFALYLGLYHALFATLIAMLRSQTRSPAPALLLTPFLWVAVELARARVTGFPWDLLGNSQVENIFVIQLAPLAGVMAISYLVAAVNAALAASFVLTGRKAAWTSIVAAISAITIIMLGSRGIKTDPATMKDPHLAIMLQENLAVGAAGREAAPVSLADELETFAQATLHPGSHRSMDLSLWKLPQGSRPDILIWPEAPSHLRSDDPQFQQSVGDLARALHAPAIIGSLGVDFSQASPRGYFEYDSASLFGASGSYQGRYDKIHLVPWGEYIPFKRFFSFAQKLTEGVGDMDPGTRRDVFTAQGRRYGTFICYESIFGDEVRQFVKNGAEVLVNISDDGWYGDTGAPWQHLNMARMRAIENNRWLLRATNTGVTVAIDPMGRMHAEAPRHLRAAFAFPFQFIEVTTFYTRHGDWFAWLCTAISAGALAAAFALKQRSRTGTGTTDPGPLNR